MSCVELENGDLETNSDNILESCLEELTLIQNKAEYCPIRPKDLPPIPEVQAERMQDHFSSGKGITFDLISDSFLKITKNIQIFCDLWTRNVFKLVSHFVGNT